MVVLMHFHRRIQPLKRSIGWRSLAADPRELPPDENRSGQNDAGNRERPENYDSDHECRGEGNERDDHERARDERVP